MMTEIILDGDVTRRLAQRKCSGMEQRCPAGRSRDCSYFALRSRVFSWTTGNLMNCHPSRRSEALGTIEDLQCGAGDLLFNSPRQKQVPRAATAKFPSPPNGVAAARGMTVSRGIRQREFNT